MPPPVKIERLMDGGMPEPDTVYRAPFGTGVGDTRQEPPPLGGEGRGPFASAGPKATEVSAASARADAATRCLRAMDLLLISGRDARISPCALQWSNHTPRARSSTDKSSECPR